MPLLWLSTAPSVQQQHCSHCCPCRFTRLFTSYSEVPLGWTQCLTHSHSPGSVTAPVGTTHTDTQMLNVIVPCSFPPLFVVVSTFNVIPCLLLPSDKSILPLGASLTFYLFWEVPFDYCVSPPPISASTHLLYCCWGTYCVLSHWWALFPRQTHLPRTGAVLSLFRLPHSMIKHRAGHQ